MTVVIGVVTAAVVPVGVVTVTVATGVLTATVAATVTGGVGIGRVGRVGRETVGARSVVGDSVGATSAVDEATGACSASPPKTCLAAGTALTLAPPAVLR